MFTCRLEIARACRRYLPPENTNKHTHTHTLSHTHTQHLEKVEGVPFLTAATPQTYNLCTTALRIRTLTCKAMSPETGTAPMKYNEMSAFAKVRVSASRKELAQRTCSGSLLRQTCSNLAQIMLILPRDVAQQTCSESLRKTCPKKRAERTCYDNFA